MSKTYYFISDLHLGLQSPEKEKAKENLFVDFIEKIKDDADELFILGDLFDYWFEYKRVIQKGFVKTLAALQSLSEKGVKIHYLIGNHDFLHKNFFEEEIGAILYEDPLEIELNGAKFFLGHGDGLIKKDTGYNILKKILRNKFLQKVYSIIHPDFGIWVASKTSKKSRDYTSQKNYGTIDGLKETAAEKIKEGFDYIMFGHSHQRIFEQMDNGYYINLGSWLDDPCYGKFQNNRFEIIDWKKND